MEFQVFTLHSSLCAIVSMMLMCIVYPDGSVLVGGSFEGTVHFGTGRGEISFTATNDKDIVLAKYDPGAYLSIVSMQRP